jgi:hypothetical protein
MRFDPPTADFGLDPTNGDYQQGGPWGTIVRHKSRWPRRGDPSPLAWWTPYVKQTLVSLNRETHHYACLAWKNGLTSAQRLAWKTYAATTTMYSYKRVARTPNGFQVFVKMFRLNSYLAFNPYQPRGNVGILTSLTSPPVAWSELPAPSVSAITDFGGGTIQLDLDNTPNQNDLFLYCEISRGTSSAERPASWYSAWQFSLSYSPGNPNSHIFLDLTYPFYPLGKVRNLRLALLWEDAHDYRWSDFTTLPVFA